MIDKETGKKMLENRACDGVGCAECPILAFNYLKRCCKKKYAPMKTAIDGRKFRSRVVRLLTEWLAE